MEAVHAECPPHSDLNTQRMVLATFIDLSWKYNVARRSFTALFHTICQSLLCFMIGALKY